ncbi:hypothetical protein MNBD_UNCLBAC01-239 [hydrothermal vent metagenome]|uniref:Uncharacterized protein n=1 Tax=hydrothermal vent metagenome TaxID=652676 RepID=A0A3B1E0W5_9ZZZZ
MILSVEKLIPDGSKKRRNGGLVVTISLTKSLTNNQYIRYYLRNDLDLIY